MSNPASSAEPDIYVRSYRAWERFWFTPADPTLLGLIRICCGLITLYTMVVYTFALYEFVGPDAWYDLKARLEIVRNRPIAVSPLGWDEMPNLPPVAEPQKKDFEEYVKKYQTDPRLLYARGTPVWSVWFHVTDPTWMMICHLALVMVTLLFTLGLFTRVTAVLTWFAALSYIHRTPVMLFGVDTMMTILLMYLMIGPSGAALSLDRVLARWWSRARPNVVARWRSWWGRLVSVGRIANPSYIAEEMAPGAYQPRPQPSISANIAIRLLQIHVCIIYLASGLSKLQGTAWWNGTAIWGVLANFEFAPMQFGLYNHVLRRLCSNHLMLQCFLTAGGLFTLAFEIGYTFLIWRPATRWVFLWGAITLHGLIGLFMGLKTFSLMMLVMNMAFLSHAEVQRFLGWVDQAFGRKTSSPPRQAVEMASSGS